MNKGKFLFPNYELPWPEPFIPTYRMMSVGPWRCKPTPDAEKVLGYFRPHNFAPKGWIFEKKAKDEWVKWMSLTPMESESHMPHIAAAKGTVVVAGLGMGFYVYNIIRRPEVERVIVVEKDRDLVRLFDRAIDRLQWKGRNKFELVIKDALEYKPDHHVDFLYADIWPFLGDSEALSLTKQIQANIKAEQVGFWGQEFDFATWLIEHKLRIERASLEQYRGFCRDTGLPLVEQDNRKYPRLAAAAVILQTSAKVTDKDRHLYLMSTALSLLQTGLVLDQAIKAP